MQFTHVVHWLYVVAHPLHTQPTHVVGDEITPNPEALRFTFNPAEPSRKKKQKEEPTFYRDQVSIVSHCHML